MPLMGCIGRRNMAEEQYISEFEDISTETPQIWKTKRKEELRKNGIEYPSL